MFSEIVAQENLQNKLMWSVSEVAGLSGIPRRRWLMWINEKKLPSLKYGKKHLLNRNHIDNFLNASIV